jgi:Tfp pilus assembly PilM family ATPase
MLNRVWKAGDSGARNGGSWTPRHSRVIAVEAGADSIKAALVERTSSGARILEQRVVGLRDHEALSEAEAAHEFREQVQQWGNHPVVLVLPQHLVISRIINLPPDSSETIQAAIERETGKLSGLSESAIVFDYEALKPFGPYENPFWLTLARESEVEALVTRLGLEEERIGEIIPGANALAAAELQLLGSAEARVIADLGSATTTVIILVNDQLVFATSFPVGTDAFTEAVAAQKLCSFEVAEAIRRSNDLFTGKHYLPGFEPAVDEWHSELQRVLNEWRREHPECVPAVSGAKIVLAGGGAMQPGLAEYLQHERKARIERWPSGEEEGTAPPARLAAAYGAALQALGRSPGAASLLPTRLRAQREQQQTVHRLYSAAALLVVLAGLLLVAGIWQKVRAIQAKQALIRQAQSAYQTARAAETVTREAALEYQRLRPVLERQKHSLDTLKVIAALHTVRTNRNLWFTLLADEATYFSAPEIAAGTNEVAQTNGTYRPSGPPARDALVAEITIPGEPETTRRLLSQVALELKQSPALRNVDSLATDLRRSLVLPRLVLTNQTFSLSLQLADNEFSASSGVGAISPAAALNESGSPGGRTFRQRTDTLPANPSESR